MQHDDIIEILLIIAAAILVAILIALGVADAVTQDEACARRYGGPMEDAQCRVITQRRR